MKNSVGNVTEILQLLDKETYNATQIRENYQYLVSKWGEWEIIGENSAGFVVRYVDVGAALFSGLMIVYACLSAAALCLAIVFGKIVFPLLAKHYKSANDEMVDMATLTSATLIEQMSKETKKTKKNEEGWF